ncbi:MAG: hypothetical protein Q9216_004877, partial [Gyalolechia sp. 2 TL-2023]
MALDDVVMTERTARRGRGRGRRVPNPGRKATAPVGGVQKNKAPKGPMKPVVPNGLLSTGKESKIIVSNLPGDVTEKMVKDYFNESIGPVKRVTLSYGPNGVMKGIVTIVFVRAESATKALETLDGVKVDKRPMKIEVVLDASKATATAPTKALGDRITPGKGPKPVTAAKPATNGATTRGGRAQGRGGRRGRNAGRAKPKTADELDAEMVDYFDPTNTNGVIQGGDAATTNGTAQTAANLDAGMDEIV